MSAALLLLADSQLLFRSDKAPALHNIIRERFVSVPGAGYPDAAYIGAANHNDPAFYELACQGLSVMLGRPCNTRFIRCEADLPDAPCQLVILAGGNVSTGWAFLRKPRVTAWLEGCRQQDNSLIIGVSAGAIHMARGCDPDVQASRCQIFLDWLPAQVAVHEEQHNWPSLQQPVQDVAPAFAIPMAGGLWVEFAANRPLRLGSVGAGCFCVSALQRWEPVARLQ